MFYWVEQKIVAHIVEDPFFHRTKEEEMEHENHLEKLRSAGWKVIALTSEQVSSGEMTKVLEKAGVPKVGSG